ncbi:DUF115 domain-containing protein [Sporolactobacillus sp. THM7-4]|nr:DUF115 domain-containing protein [Sporolactobacillus sp. THM7-4]
MMLIENRNYLRLHNRSLLEVLKKTEDETDDHIQCESARSGKPTLKIDKGSGFHYVHSKYDPEKEGAQLISRIESLEQCDHIIFIGSGLGYAILALAKAFPQIKISIFEPDPQVLLQLFSYQRLDKLSSQIGFITCNEKKLEDYIFVTAQKKQDRFKFYILPFYEREYSGRVKELINTLNNGIRLKNNNVETNFVFQQRWILNVLKNFPVILRTPNILLDIGSEVFKGKPVVLVAAGPSLNFEWENLRSIKKNGLAYIFSVGSAINALIKHDIYPDAVCTYDPQEKNAQVVQIIVDKQIKQIPLIFGSSVGYETLENYPGPMAHMMISEDTFSPQVLRTTTGVEVPSIMDQPSIAIITLELLARLQVGSIILVGQNLGFLNNQFYADGISYESRSTELNETEKQSTLTIESVDGDKIQTNDSFLSMHRQMEAIVNAISPQEVINTTKGGAAIKGTTFVPLEDLIHDRLSQKVVVHRWEQAENHYDRVTLNKRMNNLVTCKEDFKLEMGEWQKSLIQFGKIMKKGDEQQINSALTKVDKLFHRIQKNHFFKTLIAPMIRVQMDHIRQIFQVVRFEKNISKKAESVLHEFRKIYQDIVTNYTVIGPVFDQLEERVLH